MNAVKNNATLYGFTALLGAVVGAVVWLFLRLVGIGHELIWQVLPQATDWQFLPLVLCALGGLAAGLMRYRYGDYPEELPVILQTIKRDKHYSYDSMLVMLVSAFIPLVFGASVGPEAGLTGIIAALCYWVGDNVAYAKEHASAYTEAGAAATLASLFAMPLFGIFAVEESRMASTANRGVSYPLPRASKIVLYGIASISAFLVMKGLGVMLGSAGMGFPHLEFQGITPADYALCLLYIPVGFLLYIGFTYSEKLCSHLARLVPPIARETLCGVCIGAMALAFPIVLFSGEEALAELPATFGSYLPWALVGIGMLKLLLTAFCIKFGMKGGHFFPVIFACSCTGFGIAALLFADPSAHAVFAAAVITAAMLGASMGKPVATTMLLLICFPMQLVLLILAAAAAGSWLAATARIRMAHTRDEL